MMFYRLTGDGLISNEASMFISHVPAVTTVSFSSDKYISVEADWVYFYFFCDTKRGY